MPKPKGLFSIGQIASVCGVSLDTLRFYESKALIQPAHIDMKSGYRYYSLENLFRLRTILGLRDTGLSLLETKDYLEGRKHTEENIATLTERMELLKNAIDNLRIRSTGHGELTVHELVLPERLCLCRTIEARDAGHAVAEIAAFYDELICRGVAISRAWPEFCEYPDYELLTGEFKTTSFTVTACLPVEKRNAPDGAVRYSSGNAIEVDYRGSYYGLPSAYEALRKYIEKLGYTTCGYPQEIYVEIDADGSVRPDGTDNLTRVIVPINKTHKQKSEAY